MDALYYIIIILFVITCLLLVGIILMQSSQSGGMGSALAGNALNSAFGGQQADKLLVRVTTFLAATFMLLAILLNVLSTPGSNDIPTSSSNSILDRNKVESIDSGKDQTFEIPVEGNGETVE